MKIEILLKDRLVVIENATEIRGKVEISEPEQEHEFNAADILEYKVVTQEDK